VPLPRRCWLGDTKGIRPMKYPPVGLKLDKSEPLWDRMSFILPTSRNAIKIESNSVNSLLSQCSDRLTVKFHRCSDAVCFMQTGKFLKYALLMSVQRGNHLNDQFLTFTTFCLCFFVYDYWTSALCLWGCLCPVHAGCGGRIEESSGVIRSPSFPAWYPPYRDCYWTVIVPAGSYVEFTIGFFELEQSDNCTKDYLEVKKSIC